MTNIASIIFLLFTVSFVGILAKKYKFPLHIVLVLVGICISLVPQFPPLTLNPEIIFIIFLPPLLQDAAWKTGWHQFKVNIRPISLAAIGLVITTTVTVALSAHYIIPNMSLPICFVLGAIVSPPDVIAATSLIKGLGLRPKIITILEGESLINDASGLIAYKYALLAVLAGQFTFWDAGVNFLLVSTAGVAIGLVFGYLMAKIQVYLIKDAIIEATFTILMPFASYLIAEYLSVSGVLSVVTTGLFVSQKSVKIFTHQGRLIGYSVWGVITFILNGFTFILIGLQLRSVLEGVREYDTKSIVFYGFCVALVVILTRFIWVVPAVYLPRILSRKIRREPFDPRNLVVFGWAGMRGVVTMAAALALPIHLYDGTAFPKRNLIIYLAFCVILFTLIVLGLTLPLVTKRLKMIPFSGENQEYQIRKKILKASLNYIEENFSGRTDPVASFIKEKYIVKYDRLQKKEHNSDYSPNDNDYIKTVSSRTNLQLELLEVERDSIIQMHANGQVSEEILRKIEHELDMEATRLTNELSKL